ncbi:MAG: anthranilate synthase component I [Succiniclasticum sp.]|jgi:anthranilate synthase component 1
MAIRPSLEEVRKLAAQGYRTVPVCLELYADFTTPIEVLRKLKRVSSHVFLLESVEDSKQWGRYTFLGYDPKLELTCRDGVLTLRGETTEVQHVRHPGEMVRRIAEENKGPRLPYLPPFTGGLVGYWSYDYLKYAEPSLRLDAADAEGFRDLDLMLFDKVVAFDNFRQKILLINRVRCEDLEKEYDRASRTLDQMRDLLLQGKPYQDVPGHTTTDFHALFDEKAYCQMVEKAKQYIYDGDIFQVVLSNRFEAGYEGSLLDTYRVLRTLNPSPYLFYFSSDDIEMAGASPETLVKLDNGILHTFPLAGTRRRGDTQEEDEALERELLSDEKERAEHNMLVDLGRNDIGKVSRFGSVAVEKYGMVLKYSHVMHLGSTVRGTLRKDKDAVDAMDAILPAGTLSGAPKIRACQIINELENNKRGIYGGAIGYLDFSGSLDACIAIRFCVKKNGKVFVRSGAGIVADSVPAREYQECLNKARAVFVALETAQEGMDR